MIASPPVRRPKGGAHRSGPLQRIVRSAGLAALSALVLANAGFPANPVFAAARAKALLRPNGAAPKPPQAFVWGGTTAGGLDAAAGAAEAFGRLPLTRGLFSVLIIGSDARPGQPADRSRGDSIHLLVFNPVTQRGTLIGFPRDSYVAIPGHGKSKITSALAWGGPELMTETVSALTAIPVGHYIVTGFAGFTALVDAVGGVSVLVDPKMNDRFSGATFAKGWFSMNGNAALAFNRNRHDVPRGDLGRSANQAKFLLSALATMRSTTTDNGGLLRWVAALKANTTTNLPLKDLLVFAEAARAVPPGSIGSVVVPGRTATVGSGKARQSVVVVRPEAKALFADVAADGVRGT